MQSHRGEDDLSRHGGRNKARGLSRQGPEQMSLQRVGLTSQPGEEILHVKKVKLLRIVQLFVSPCTVACQAPPSMGFSRQEYWSGLPFPSPGDLPDPGFEPRSPTLQADTYHLSHQGIPGVNTGAIGNRQRIFRMVECQNTYRLL